MPPDKRTLLLQAYLQLADVDMPQRSVAVQSESSGTARCLPIARQAPETHAAATAAAIPAGPPPSTATS